MVSHSFPLFLGILHDFFYSLTNTLHTNDFQIKRKITSVLSTNICIPNAFWVLLPDGYCKLDVFEIEILFPQKAPLPVCPKQKFMIYQSPGHLRRKTFVSFLFLPSPSYRRRWNIYIYIYWWNAGVFIKWGSTGLEEQNQIISCVRHYEWCEIRSSHL